MILTSTTMSCPLLSDTLDLIVDQLHDDPATLKACCLSSKSWAPRTRRHLFASVQFGPPGPTIESWMETFPDPLNTPARYTRTLIILDIRPAVAAAAIQWIRAFQNVARLHIVALARAESDKDLSLAQLNGLSPAVKSLRMGFDSTPLSEVFDFMCSFPSLEDLALFHIGREDDSDQWCCPQTSPSFSGSLMLGGMWGIGPIAYRLMELPNGLRFTKVALVCVDEEDFEWVDELVSGCSDTLEDLNVTCNFPGVYPPPPLLVGSSPLCSDAPASSFDLSTATKLKGLTFQCTQPGVQWITTALETTQPKDIPQISIHLVDTALENMAEEVIQEWKDLDRLLVQSYLSHPISLRVASVPDEDGLYLSEYMMILLPGLTRRGLVDVVEPSS